MDDKERFRSLDGFLKNTISEKESQDRAIIKQNKEFADAQRQKGSDAYLKRRKWSAEPKPDQNLLKFRDERGGVVIEVLDGNSLVLQDNDTGENLRVRLYGVDAPELQQEHGGAAKLYLEGLVLNKKLTFRVKAERYAYRVMISVDKVSTNLLMVKNGHAMKSLEYEDQYSEAFIKAELDAKISRLGIWSYASPPYPAWNRRLDIIEYKRKQQENSQGLSLVERSALTRKHAIKYNEDIKIWRSKWYVKVFAPLGLGNFLKPPKFGE